MSEESSTDAPGTAASGDEPVPAPEDRPRRNRRALLILSGSAVLSVAMIAVALVWALAYGPPGPKYPHLPKPCALISPTTLDAYLPGATATPLTIPAGPYHSALCQWTSISGDETRTALAEVIVMGSSSAISPAQQGYTSAVSSVACHCRGVTVVTRTVTGLGDQATAVFITAKPGANLSKAPNAPSVGANLIVRSGSALIFLNYTATTATGTPVAPGTDAAQLTVLTAMARDVLAALAHPGAASPGSIAPVSPEPHYAGHRDPCRLITAATLAKYAPGAAVFPIPNTAGTPSTPQTGVCTWGVNGGTTILLVLKLYPGASGAQQAFTSDAAFSSQGTGAGTTIGTGAMRVTGTQALPGLGDQAIAVFQTQGGAPLVELWVWSGNAELQDSYYGPGGSPPDHATLLAGAIATVRDALAALANPAAAAYPQGPVYANPHQPCTLIRATTVATYLPGATASPIGAGSSPLNGCSWTEVNGALNLYVSIYSDPDGALGGFETDVQFARQQPGLTFDGAQPVKDLGQQATVVFQTSVGSPVADLYVLSGNAEVEVDFSPTPLSGPEPSRAALLAAAIVMAREALAGLPH